MLDMNSIHIYSGEQLIAYQLDRQSIVDDGSEIMFVCLFVFPGGFWILDFEFRILDLVFFCFLNHKR